MKRCYYCGKEFLEEDVRPYGPNGAHVCFECGTSPEHNDESERAFKKRLDAFLRAIFN